MTVCCEGRTRRLPSTLGVTRMANRCTSSGAIPLKPSCWLWSVAATRVIRQITILVIDEHCQANRVTEDDVCNVGSCACKPSCIPPEWIHCDMIPTPR